MKHYCPLIRFGLLLALAGCHAPAAEYTTAEAPNTVTLETAPSSFELRFAPGSSRLAAADIAWLRRAADRGAFNSVDRVTVLVGGAPKLAQARGAAITGELVKYGIVPDIVSEPHLRPDQATIGVERTLVMLPPCPNWSKPDGMDFSNMVNSNFGCATATDLARMVANPRDLVSGRAPGLADSQTAVAAVRRYYTDKVQLPTAANVGPIAAAASSSVGGSGGSSSGSQ